MTFIESPAGHLYESGMRITSDYGAEKSAWLWVGGADMRGDLCYEFDEVGLFQHEDTLDLLMAHTSGCSCPTPHEENTVADGVFITSLVEFDKFIEKNESLTYSWDDEPQKRYPEVVDQVVALRKVVEGLLDG